MKSLLATTAIAALLVTSAPAFAFDWNGGYAGVVVGYSSGSADVTYDDPFLSPLNFSMAPSGWLGGVTAGYNMATGNGVVIGIEGDLSLANITDTVVDTADPAETITSTTDWAGSMRGRIGFDAGEVMPYLTAGIAFAHATASYTDGGGGSESATLVGYTVGGGLEVAVTDSVTVKGEYLYTALNPHTWYASTAFANTSAPTSHTIKGGVNFHF